MTGGDREPFDTGMCSASIGGIGDAAHQMNPARPRIAPVKPRIKERGVAAALHHKSLAAAHARTKAKRFPRPQEGFWSPFSFLLFAPSPPPAHAGDKRETGRSKALQKSCKRTRKNCGGGGKFLFSITHTVFQASFRIFPTPRIIYTHPDPAKWGVLVCCPSIPG